ncbi:MAG TPA: hypothetical protein VGA73_03865 [Candidatus Binatia bacterium]
MGKISQTRDSAALRWGGLIAAWLVCWSATGHAQIIEFKRTTQIFRELKRTDDFTGWCLKYGLFTRDSDGITCSFVIGIQAGLTAAFGKGRPGNTGCETLGSKIDFFEGADPGRQIAQPIFEWLLTNWEISTTYTKQDIDAAIWALHRCKE